MSYSTIERQADNAEESQEVQSTRIFDIGIIWAIIYNPVIWDAISEDGIEEYTPDVINEYWIGISAGGAIIGLYRVHQITSACWHGHAFILPKYRKEYSKESIKSALKWTMGNTDLQKLITEIPEKYENVYKFCKSIGFQDEGFNRDSWKKDGVLYGQHMLGMTKDEISAFIGER